MKDLFILGAAGLFSISQSSCLNQPLQGTSNKVNFDMIREAEDLTGRNPKLRGVEANDVSLTDENRKYYPDITTQRLFTRRDKRFNDWSIKKHEIWYPVTYKEYLQEQEQGNICLNDVILGPDDSVLLRIVDTRTLGTTCIIPKAVTVIRTQNLSEIIEQGENRMYSIVFPEKVREIEARAFSGLKKLLSVNLTAAKIQELKNETFRGCSSLRFVYFPIQNIQIGERCFAECSLITEFVDRIIEKTTRLEKECFMYNAFQGPDTITISPNIKYIPEGCFQGCSGVKMINIQGKDVVFEKNCFANCKDLIAVNTPNDARLQLKEGCFKNCSKLSTDSVEDILAKTTWLPKSCFSGCNSIFQVTINKNINAVEKSCFANCLGLSVVAVGNTQATFVDGCFSGCNNLHIVYLSKEDAQFKKRSIWRGLNELWFHVMPAFFKEEK